MPNQPLGKRVSSIDYSIYIESESNTRNTLPSTAAAHHTTQYQY